MAFGNSGTPDESEVLRQAIDRSVNYLFEASRQGIYLAVAIIATAPFWVDRFATSSVIAILVALVMSVVSGIAAHVAQGLRLYLAVREICLNGQWPSGIVTVRSAWVAASIQVIAFLIGFIWFVLCLV